MRPEDLNLLELLQIDQTTGSILLKDRRLLILDGDAMGFLRKELIEQWGEAATRRLLARFGYARGYRDAMTAKEIFPWQSDEDWLRAGMRLHAQEGIAGVDASIVEFDKNKGSFHVEANWANSYEAEQHRKHLGISETPV